MTNKMKAIGIVGSPRKNGNTELLTAHVLRAIAEEGLETELVRLAELQIQPCKGCYTCKREKECPTEDDLYPVYKKMKAADGIILSTPVYFGSATALVKSLMERTGRISRSEGDPFKHKVGGPLVVARRAGKTFTFAQMSLWFQILGFFVPGSTYWSVAIAREKGEVQQDDEGLRTAWNFGKNMAFLIKKLKS